MKNALRRCGFNVATAQDLINQGFETPEKLLLASESDFDLVARTVARTPPPGAGNVTMPFIAVKHLKGFRFWAD